MNEQQIPSFSCLSQKARRLVGRASLFVITTSWVSRVETILLDGSFLFRWWSRG